MNSSKDIFLFLLLEQAQQFEKLSVLLDRAEGGNVIAQAKKNLLSAKKEAYRTIEAYKFKPKTEYYTDCLESFKFTLDKVLRADYQRILKKLLPENEDEDETKCFYVKMFADYYRKSTNERRSGGL